MPGRPKTSKSALIRKIMEALRDNATRVADAARTAHDEATHEENRVEDPYDTRALEASYLAAGQARQMEGVAEALQQYGVMVPRKFGPRDAVDVGALVGVESDGERRRYFIGPGAGGMEITLGGKNILVLTPQSPLGAQFIGRHKGDAPTLRIGDRPVKYRILSIT